MCAEIPYYLGTQKWHTTFDVTLQWLQSREKQETLIGVSIARPNGLLLSVQLRLNDPAPYSLILLELSVIISLSCEFAFVEGGRQ